MLVFCFQYSNAQCPPAIAVNLTASNTAVFSQTAATIGPLNGADKCCSSDPNGGKSIRFSITLHPNSMGILFEMSPGSISDVYRINCGPAINVGSAVCLTGAGPHILTFSKTSNTTSLFKITSIAKPTAGPNVSIASGCTQVINATGFGSNISWTSIPTNAYNSYLSCLNCLNPTVTPGNSPPAYVDYQISGFTATSGCNQFYDTVRVYLTAPLAVSIFPSNPTICKGQTPNSTQITATGSGGTGTYTYLWNNINPSQNIIVGNGVYTVKLSDGSACPPVYATVTITSYTVPVMANAGPDITLCSQNAIATLNGTVAGAFGGIWSGGAGIYSPNASTLSAVYTPTSAELLAGFVELTLTTVGNGTCAAAADVVKIYFQGFTGVTSTVVSPLSCFGGSDGAITANVVGGMAPFTYSWNTVPYQTAATATGLAFGNYQVTITDAIGCTKLIPETIIQPSPVLLAATIINTTCPGGSNGSISIAASGGTGPYTYNWQPGNQTASSISNQLAGTYTVTVKDSKMCTIVSNYTITQPAAILISLTPFNVNCFNGNDGKVNATVTGGTTPYTYSWSSGVNTLNANTLIAGTYTLTVTDINYCTASNTAIVTQAAAIVANISITNETCSYSNDGTVSAAVSGGSPGYTYLWQPGAITTSTANNLSAGTYTLITTDSKGCTKTQFATITQPAALTINFISQINVSCFGGNNGQVTASPVGGTQAYTFLWASGGGTSATITNLTEGTYTVNVTDSKGCTANNSVSISAPVAPLSAIATITHVLCNGQSNGSVAITPSGGTGPYSYLWQPGNQTTQQITGQIAGTYTVTVKDSKACQLVLTNIVTQPTALNITITATNVNCFGGNNGSINTIVSGGNSPYTYSWSNGATTAALSNLTAQSYTLTLIDSKGCGITRVVNITQPSLLAHNATITNIVCSGGNTGVIALVPTGGTSPYTYLWAPGNQTTASIINLSIGTHTVTVTDSKGCQLVSNYTVSQLSLTITLTATNTSCNGGSNGSITAVSSGGTPNYIYSWAPGAASTNSISNLTAGTYTLSITDSKGCTANNTAVVSQPSAVISAINSSNETCDYLNNGSATAVPSGGTPGYTYSWQPALQTTGTISNLVAATYTLTVKDSKGCTGVSTTTITQPIALNITFSGQSNVSTCFGGNNGGITGIASNGTPSYTYTWQPGGATTSTISNITAGTYTLTANDFNGCVTTKTVVITQPTIVAASIPNANITNETCSYSDNGSATAIVSGGTPTYTYLWQPGAITTNPASNLAAGTYTFTVTDVKGCTKTATAIITQPSNLSVAFTTPIHVNCFGGSNGTVSSVISGGSPNYTYSWAPGGATSASRNNLQAGTHTLTVTDAKGCTANNSIIITQPLALSANVTNTSETCNYLNNGTATSTPSGGTPVYTYLWKPGLQTTNSISGQATGTYTVIVTDSKGCTSTVSSSIAEPVVLSLSFNSQTNVSTCYGANNGSVTSIPAGGTAAYTYLWSPGGATTPSISGLTAGTYIATLTDFNGCVATNSVTITQPTLLTVSTSKTNETCNYLNNGTATAVGSGGIPGTGYTYLWQAGAFTANPVNNLSAGTYTVTVTDSKGCTATTQAIITEPSLLAVNFSGQINVSCIGGSNGTVSAAASGGTANYSYLWAPGGATTAFRNNLQAGAHTVTVTDSKGCTADKTIIITEPTAISVNISNTAEICNYLNNGTATSVSTGGTPGYTYLWKPGLQTTSAVSNLSSGTYTLIVTDINSCTSTVTTTITEPTAVAISFTSQINVSTCYGANNGSVSSVSSGGTAPYTYLWSPGGATTASIANLTAGTYTLTLTDSKACVATNSLTITQPTLLAASIAKTNETCNYLNNGTATVTGSGGTPAYTYLWSNAATTAAITGLSSQTYSVTVTDSKGCTVLKQITIAEPSLLVVNFSGQTNVSCLGGANGNVTATGTGGTANYTYSWAPGGATTSSRNNLQAVIHTVTVTDSKGCTAQNTVTITEPTLLSVSTSITNESCNYLNDGIAIASPAGGTAAYTYLWQPGLQTTGTVSNLSSGTYTVTVTDSKGCTATANAIISEPSTLAVSFNNQINISNCFGDNSGSVSSTTTGGTSAYTYLWSPGGATTTAIANITAGTYTLNVLDAKGCTATNTVVITQPTILSASATSTSESCDYQNNGTATVTGSGGTPGAGYTYLWSNAATTSTVSNLSSQNYTVTVTDSKGCAATAQATVTEPAILAVNFSGQINVSCFGGSDGTVSSIPTGGTPNYTYVWSPGGATTGNRTNLAAVIHTVTITDSKGCVDTNTITISQPTTLTASTSTTNENCNYLNDGTATALPSGGTATYTYLWQPGFQTTVTKTNLAVGTYTVTVTDSKGCTTTATATITEPLALSISFSNQTNVSCLGGNNGLVTAVPAGGTPNYTYLWPQGGATTATNTGLTATTFSVQVTDSKGCIATDSVTITQPTLLFVSTTKTDETCSYLNDGTALASGSGGSPGYTYVWQPGGLIGNSVSGLSSGTYTVTETDALGCTDTALAIITEPDPIIISFAGITNASCSGGNQGAVAANVTGGTLNYTYSWLPGGQTTNAISNLTANTYSISVTDAEGCNQTNTVVITEPAPLTVSANFVSPKCFNASDGSIEAIAVGGTAPYTYAWITPIPSLAYGPSINNIHAGTYSVTVWDAMACTASNSFNVTQPNPILLTIDTVNSGCNLATGAASVSVSGGVAPFTYLWTTGTTTFTIVNPTNDTINNLIADAYAVQVTDANGCKEGAWANVKDDSAATVNISMTMPSCHNGANGTATANTTGGYGALTYLWKPGLQTTATATGLSTGIYTVFVTTMPNGCKSSDTDSLYQPSPLLLLTDNDEVSCYGGTDGKAMAGTLGGTPGYTYLWMPGNLTDSAIVVPANTYTVTVTDSKGCTKINTSTVTQPAAAVSLSINSIIPVDCYAESTGSAYASNATGGNGLVYQYNWLPGNINGKDASNLIAGTYTITATDYKGCTGSASAIVVQPPLLTVDIINQINVSCYGGNNGSLSSSIAGGNPGYTYLWKPGGETTTSISNLTEGVDSLIIIDTKGCIAKDSVTITQPTLLEDSIFSVNETCDYLNNGSSEAFPTGGTAPYSYSWSNGSTLAQISSLPSQTYSITITDFLGCNVNTTSIVTEPSLLGISTTQVNINCYGGSTGSISGTASGGTPGYTYSWAPGVATTANRTNLIAGTYTLTVTDNNFCEAQKIITLTQPAAPLTANISYVPVSCNGGSDGSITIAAAGGTVPYNYICMPGNYTGANVVNLTIGSYTVTITDAKACMYVSPAVVIIEPTPMVLASTSINSNCSNADGKATVFASGGAGSYLYQWAPTGGTNNTANALLSGTYTVTVTDNNLCTANEIITVGNNSSPSVVFSSTSNVSCNGGSNGTASVIATGNYGPFTYQWQPSGGTNSSATGLLPGTYTVVVTDANACESSPAISPEITEAPAILISLNYFPVSCYGANDGYALADISGGTPGYDYFWSTNETTNVISNLPPQTYTLTITDTNSCVEATSFTITAPAAPLTLTLTSTPVSCYGGSDGTVTPVSTGGTAPYGYFWSPINVFANAISNLTSQTYIVSASDLRGCTIIDSIVVSQPLNLQLIVDSVNSICSIANGQASVNVTGGTGAYSYQWSPSGGNSASASALLSGTYTVTVTDANSCVAAKGVTVNDSQAPLVSIASTSNVSCNGGSDGTATSSVTSSNGPFTYLWQPIGGTNSVATGLTPGNYTLTVTDANLCPSLQVVSPLITQPSPILITISNYPVSCFGAIDGSAAATASGGTPGYTYSWSNGSTNFEINNLIAQTYTVVVTDTNSCVDSSSVIITEPSAPISVVLSYTAVSCFDGSDGTAAAVASGGTAPYGYFWSIVNVFADTIVNLISETYDVSASDMRGCTINASITVSQPGKLNLIMDSINSTCSFSNGIASVTVAGGTGPFIYQWSPSGGTNASATGLLAGTYTVSVIDNNLCNAVNSVTVNDSPIPVVTVVSVTNESCNGGASGTATPLIIGNYGPFTYDWQPSGKTDAVATGLLAGTHTVTVTDANLCQSLPATSAAITEPPPILITLDLVPLTCFGGGDGTASAIASGGTAGYTYLWSTGVTLTQISNLSSQPYTITVTDTNSCIASTIFTVGSPDSLSVSFTNTPISCYGGNDGAIYSTATGGTGPYDYIWSPVNINAQNIFNLAIGSYTVNLLDSKGCGYFDTISITQPPKIVLLMDSVNSNCSLPNGKASVLASGGTGAYTYEWLPGGGTNASDITLLSGSYSVTVTDNNSCSTSGAVIVNDNPIPIVTLSSTTNVNCFGSNEGEILVVVTSSNGPFTYNWQPSGGTTAAASGLLAGTYTLIVTDKNMCESEPFKSTEITEPPPISINIESTIVSCYGGSDGSATATVSGGVAGYTYMWNTGSTDLQILNQPSQLYTLTVTDANGCNKTATITIEEPSAPLSVSASFTPINCYGVAEGSLFASVLGGTAPYNYLWMPGNLNGENQYNIPMGTYIVLATDSKNCIIKDTIVISQPTLLQVTTDSSNSNCSLANGAASVIATGGAGSYLYSWLPSGGTNSSATGLLSGTYTVSVTDANACITSDEITINDNPIPIANIISSTNISCEGGSDGTIVSSVIGNHGPFSYAWLPSGGGGSTATGLLPGTYTLTVTDTNGCQSLEAISPLITQPFPITINITTSIMNCFGENDETASAIATGGTASYTYKWLPSGITGSSIGNLSGNNYSIEVTDANNCVKVELFTIDEPDSLIASISTIKNVSCYGESTGFATVTATGGTPVYNYNWLPAGGNGATGTSLGPNTYTVTITDLNGCIATDAVTITEPLQALSATFTKTDINCYALGDGTANINSIGGTPSYLYSWSPSVSNTNSASGLSPGAYTVLVTDFNACEANVSFDIKEPTALLGSFSIIDPYCNLPNGSIASQISGGSYPYAYLWTPGLSTNSSIIGNSQGAYSLKITDSLNCSIILSTTLTDLPPPVIDILAVNNINCFGGNDGNAEISISQGKAPYSIIWAPGGGNALTADSLVSGAYTIDVTDALGCATSESIIITEPTILNLSDLSVGNNICFGENNGSVSLTVTGGIGNYNYLWIPAISNSSSASNVPSGVYILDVTDQNNCLVNVSINITEPELLTSTIDSLFYPVCYNDFGRAKVFADGGVGPYSFLWAPTGSTESEENSITAGSYTITVTDANGCVSTNNLIFTNPTEVITTSGGDDTLCLGQTVILSATATGGSGNYIYAWQPSAAITAGTLPVSPTTDITYTVVAYDDIGCPGAQATISVLVYTLDSSSVEVIGFSPICIGQNSVIYVETYGKTGALTYQWNNGLGTGPGVYVVTPTQPTTYIVTVSNICNSVTDSIEVTFNPQPIISLTSDTSALCAPGVMQFYDNSIAGNPNDPITGWDWDFGDGISSNLEDPSHLYTIPDTFLVTLTITTSGGCTANNLSTPLIITGYPFPVAAFSVNSTYLELPFDELICNNLSTGGIIYDWSFGDGYFSSEINPQHLYTYIDTFGVQLIVMNQFGCLDTAYTKVTTNADVTFPTAFTPNLDGVSGGTYDINSLNNDIFFPYTSGVIAYSLEVYNRWGEMVFETKDFKIGWDGYYKGVLCPQDVYIWVATIKLNNGNTYNKNGNISLLR